MPSAFHTIVFRGLAIGIFDDIAATVNAALRGVGPARLVTKLFAASVQPIGER